MIKSKSISDYNPNKLELIVVVGKELPSSLLQLLQQENFNWQVNYKDKCFTRITRVETQDEMKELSTFCNANNLNMLIMLGADDRSYVNVIKEAPKYTRVVVYLDNKSIAASFLQNPSAELFTNWTSAAYNEPTETVFEYSNNNDINSSVAKGFTTWLQQQSRQKHYDAKIAELSESDFVSIGEHKIHKTCKLISQNGRVWTGVPNPFKGIKLKNQWTTVSSFYLQAAASKDNENLSDRKKLHTPDFVINIIKKPAPNSIRVIFEPLDPKDEKSVKLMQRKIEQAVKLLSDSGKQKKVACRITYCDEIVIDIPKLIIKSDYTRCEGQGTIEVLHIEPKAGVKFEVAFASLD